MRHPCFPTEKVSKVAFFLFQFQLFSTLNFFFNVLALENILVALTREIGDGPCFLYIEFSWIGVVNVFSPYGQSYQNHDQTNKQFCLVGMKESLWHMVDVLLRRLKIYVP